MTFVMHDFGPPLTNARIAELERELGVTLTTDYRIFLMKHNGGRPDPRFFPVRGLDGNLFRGIQIFFGVDSKIKSTNVDWNYLTYLGRIPRNLLPIACDDEGNLICLSLGELDEGSINYWDHNNEHSPPSYDNVHLIADTFGDFLDGIHFEDLSAQVKALKGKLIKGPH